MTDEDVMFVADHIAHNIETITERFIEESSYLPFDDYVLMAVVTDLSWKYTRYQVQEAFEDSRIKLLLEFFITEEDYKDYNTIH